MAETDGAERGDGVVSDSVDLLRTWLQQMLSVDGSVVKKGKSKVPERILL